MRTSIALLTLVALCACGRNKDKDKTAAEGTTRERAHAAAPAYKPVFPEAEAVGVLRAISDAEVATAGVALQVTQSDPVLAYSRVIASDYRGIAQLLDSMTLATGQVVTDNALSTELRTAGDSMASALRRLPAGFNNTYIEEQVKAHQETLQLMDTALIPSARTPQVRGLLIAIRPTVVAHLQRSLQILAERKRAAQESGEPWESGFNATPPASGGVYVPSPGDTATPARDSARPSETESERPANRDSSPSSERTSARPADEPPKLLGEPIGGDTIPRSR